MIYCRFLFAVSVFAALARTATARMADTLHRLELNSETLRGYTDEAKQDHIQHLPGLERMPAFRQFSGYLEVDREAGRNIFYWFTESEKDPMNAPVLFWTNGGPGCSGLLGFLTEQGPFRVNQDGSKLDMNPFAWNKEVNIFFVEQPAGVGFSYSEDASFYDGVGDTEAAEDNYRIIVQFFKRFPQFKANQFFISSESYGGHYMPMLAKQIVDKQASLSAPDEKINFQGLLVGNPYNNPDENILGMVESFWGRQLMPKTLLDEWYKKCIVQTHVCPMWATSCKSGTRHDSDPQSLHECEKLEELMKSAAGNLNPYGLDWPVCNDVVKRHGRNQRHLLLKLLGEARGQKHDPDEAFKPCEEGYAMVYLNRADVQKAIHVRHTPTSAEKWGECANRHLLQYNETELSV